ncbi:MAG TPA: restriction endonuclease [Actinobacteria bacterium]|nr:restriction endonuclease [Actinomycetota bacterium]
MPEYDFRDAVTKCWTIRADAAERQADRGITDVGLRAEVTSGRHMAPLENLVAQIFIDAGLPESSLFLKSKRELPGYFRAEKQWDIVAVHKGSLVAAVELKSQLGSYGKNLNNRAEEAIGNAMDLIVAGKEDLLGPRPPWLGYVFIMQDDEESCAPVGVREPHFPTDREFKDASCQKRIAIMCRRFLIQRLYNAAWFVTGKPEATVESVEEPDLELTFAKFAAAIRGRVGEILA